MVPKLGRKKNFFSNFDGFASLNYSTAGSFSVNGTVAAMAYNFGFQQKNLSIKDILKIFFMVSLQA